GLALRALPPRLRRVGVDDEYQVGVLRLELVEPMGERRVERGPDRWQCAAEGVSHEGLVELQRRTERAQLGYQQAGEFTHWRAIVGWPQRDGAQRVAMRVALVGRGVALDSDTCDAPHDSRVLRD